MHRLSVDGAGALDRLVSPEVAKWVPLIRAAGAVGE
jgi:hypothetical protein